MAQRPIRSIDYSDSEEDTVEHPPGQALPIANLPFNFDGIPQDGMEYLFTVRFSPFFLPRDSRLLPRFTRVDHPTTNSAEVPRALAAEEPTSKILHSAFPTEEWRTEYVRNFMNYRQNLRRALRAQNAPGRSTSSKVWLPSWQSRNEWWRFITGSPRKSDKDLGEGSITTNGRMAFGELGFAEVTKDPHEPTLSILKQFSVRNVTGLLHWFSVWITAYADSLEDSEVQSSGDENGDRSGHATTTVGAVCAIEGVHQRWMFALLGMLDSELLGNDISTLRVIARAAIRLVQVITKDDVDSVQEGGDLPGVSDVEGVVNGGDGDEASPAAAKDVRTQSTIAGCWMVVAAIVGIWGQRDIWDEAREALSTST